MKMGSRTTTIRATRMVGRADMTGTGKHTHRTAAGTDMDSMMRMGITSKGITMATTRNDSRMMTRCGEEVSE